MNYTNQIKECWGNEYEAKMAIEAQDRAAYWEQRAAAAENYQAISSDDPAALDKLRYRLEQLSAAQEAMKTVNRAFKAKRLGELGYRPEQIASLQARMEEAFPWKRQPYPGYVLKNNNAAMRRVKQRIARLEEAQKVVNMDVLYRPSTLVSLTSETRGDSVWPRPGRRRRQAPFTN